ncbi:MAG: helix-turn-helix transcriptional regulator [Corynebacterium sp.]|nr:helix-turn-helix transcriptional regulator [Corynebacterium sp.]
MAGYRIDRELAELGENIRGWSVVLHLTAQQVCERANISRDTLRKIERGDATVGFSAVTPASYRPDLLVRSDLGYLLTEYARFSQHPLVRACAERIHPCADGDGRPAATGTVGPQ